MKILAQGIENNHIVGFQPIFMQEGHQWVWWEENHTPAFRVFDDVRPDLFFGIGEPSRATSKCIEEHKVPAILQVAPFTYKINERVFKYSVLLDDITYNRDEQNNKKFDCDIGCFTINKEPNPYFLSLCHPINKYKIVVLGNHQWNMPQYLGTCSMEEKLNLYRSAKLIFCETEEERARVIACGTIPITQQLEMSAEGYVRVVEEMLECNQLLLMKIKNQQKEWFENNVKTYQEILPELMDAIND